jgi:uncharacterized protein YyaL (SSP411 family)
MPDSPANRLAGETSPYLLQHAANPVAWQPWDDAALAEARQADRPILLSIGYSACHWCHVMAHESFEDARVAATLNRLFVCIKVDREERPDLDQIYQTAHQMLTGRAGGWPLTLFLTPDGVPFFGGTYFPPEPRYGLPAFTDLCERVAGLYRERRADIEAQNVSLVEALGSGLPEAADARLPGEEVISAARLRLLDSVDGDHGGFGDAPKFPHPTDLAFLLRRAQGDGDVPAREAALHTLTCMAEGGIYDQLGGGFCRYSVDARWEIPHFEKMLYDNALLLPVYTDAWRLRPDPLFARVVEETAGWLMREMQSPEGGYYSALDADSEGEEGRFYVWDRDEARALIAPDDWTVAGRCWRLDGPPNFEGRHWHLRVAVRPAENESARLESARRALFAARSRRVRPGCDDKILTGWNALTIGAMAKAARIFGRSDWLASARRALDFLQAHLWREGRLLATARAGRAHLPAYLDDHAFLLAAMLETMQSDFRIEDLDFAVKLADLLLAHFEDAEHGGFFFTAHDHERLIHRSKAVFDNATPSGNGIAACALQRLGHLLGESRYLDSARRALELFSPMLVRQPAGCGSLLEALEETFVPPATVLLRGPAAGVAEWQERLGREWGGFCLALPNGLTGLPAALDKPASDHVNAWVCSGVTCHAPVGEFDELRRIILNRD